jgi:hypothetical protein
MSKTFEQEFFLGYRTKDNKTIHALDERSEQERLYMWRDKRIFQQGNDVCLAIEPRSASFRTAKSTIPPKLKEIAYVITSIIQSRTKR